MTVQRDTIVKMLVGLNHHSHDGIIPAYNVLMSVLPTEFWNNFCRRIMDAVPAEKQGEVAEGLVRGYNDCGYHTGHGVVTSKEFKAVVEPMVTEGKKDILRGAFAVMTATGMSKSGIVQNKEGERMVIRSVNYYQGDGEQGDMRAFLLQGASAAFYDLVYGPPYPDGQGTFACEQVAGLECGDPFGEFIVTKKS